MAPTPQQTDEFQRGEKGCLDFAEIKLLLLAVRDTVRGSEGQGYFYYSTAPVVKEYNA